MTWPSGQRLGEHPRVNVCSDIAGRLDLFFPHGPAILDLVQDLTPHVFPRLQRILDVTRLYRFLKTPHRAISFQR
jgi:hypothetical protein